MNGLQEMIDDAKKEWNKDSEKKSELDENKDYDENAYEFLTTHKVDSNDKKTIEMVNKAWAAALIAYEMDKKNKPNKLKNLLKPLIEKHLGYAKVVGGNYLSLVKSLQELM